MSIAGMAALDASDEARILLAPESDSPQWRCRDAAGATNEPEKALVRRRT
jgi:hypothetical protein